MQHTTLLIAIGQTAEALAPGLSDSIRQLAEYPVSLERFDPYRAGTVARHALRFLAVEDCEAVGLDNAHGGPDGDLTVLVTPNPRGRQATHFLDRCIAFDAVAPKGLHDRVVARYLRFAASMQALRSTCEKHERQWLHSERLADVGLMARGVAHDMKNLLQGAVAHCQLAEFDSEAEDPVRGHLARIDTVLQLASDLADRMMHYAGDGSSQRKRIDLCGLVREMEPLLEAFVARRATLDVVVPDIAIPALADPLEIRQVLLNLVGNAVESFEASGGRIVVRCARCTADACDMARMAIDATDSAGAFGMLEVQDNGTGMDEETRARLFESRVTTKGHGHGFGLLGVATIVRKHAGALDIASQRGQGTTFRVFLPQDMPQSARPHAHVTLPPPPTLLLVEDMDLVRHATSRYLERHGYTVIAVGEAQEALAALEGDSSRRIVCAVLDLGLPGMSGQALARAVGERRSELPILIATGQRKKDLDAKTRAIAAHILEKPYTPSELCDVLATVLGVSAGRQRATDAGAREIA